MEKRSKLTEEQLNQIPKDVLVSMYLQLSDTMKQVAEQNNQLLLKVTSLEEKISILTQRQFGRKSEKENAVRICSIWKLSLMNIQFRKKS